MPKSRLRVISYQVTRKVEAGDNAAHTSETLIGYTEFCAFVLYFKQFGSISKNPKHLS
jgi:hypothetical protein